MKKCPQCNSVYENETVYCLNDGAQLIDESFSLPSADGDDEPTMIRSKPIVIDLAPHQEPPLMNQPPVPPYENVIVVPAAAAPSNKNYLLFLVVGLLIGGGLVLGTLLLSKNYFQNENTNQGAVNVNYNQAVKVEKPKPSVEIKNTNENVSVEPTPNKHDEPVENAEETSNGRVIVLNARVRFAPDKDAPIVDTLPMNDRLDIIRRQNPNSPWYQVECEHGAVGWMHGDTIEFTR